MKMKNYQMTQQEYDEYCQEYEAWADSIQLQLAKEFGFNIPTAKYDTVDHEDVENNTV